MGRHWREKITGGHQAAQVPPEGEPRAEELKAGAKPAGRMKSPLGGTYTGWLTKYHGRPALAIIHEQDQDVALILDRDTKQALYVHPLTMQGLFKINGCLQC